MMKGRWGIVKITGVMLREHIDTVAEVFAKMKAVVIRVEHLHIQDVHEYVLHSPLFEEVIEGMVIPSYTVTVTEIRDEAGAITDYEVTVTINPYHVGVYNYNYNTLVVPVEED